MKNKILAIAAAGVTFIGAQAALANCCPMDNWYTELAAGGSWHNNSYLGDGAKVDTNTGLEINFSFGLKTDCFWRLALQLHYEHYKNDDYTSPGGISIGDNGSLSTTAFFFNGFYDIPINDCLVWYLGAGAGVGVHRLKIDNSFAGNPSKSSIEFAWQLMTGFVYDLSPCWAITLNYSWINLLKPVAPTTIVTDSRKLRKSPFSNNVDLGLRLKF